MLRTGPFKALSIAKLANPQWAKLTNIITKNSVVTVSFDILPNQSAVDAYAGLWESPDGIVPPSDPLQCFSAAGASTGRQGEFSFSYDNFRARSYVLDWRPCGPVSAGTGLSSVILFTPTEDGGIANEAENVSLDISASGNTFVVKYTLPGGIIANSNAWCGYWEGSDIFNPGVQPEAAAAAKPLNSGKVMFSDAPATIKVLYTLGFFLDGFDSIGKPSDVSRKNLAATLQFTIDGK